jgi:hypothetical protein
LCLGGIEDYSGGHVIAEQGGRGGAEGNGPMVGGCRPVPHRDSVHSAAPAGQDSRGTHRRARDSWHQLAECRSRCPAPVSVQLPINSGGSTFSLSYYHVLTLGHGVAPPSRMNRPGTSSSTAARTHLSRTVRSLRHYAVRVPDEISWATAALGARRQSRCVDDLGTAGGGGEHSPPREKSRGHALASRRSWQPAGILNGSPAPVTMRASAGSCANLGPEL